MFKWYQMERPNYSSVCQSYLPWAFHDKIVISSARAGVYKSSFKIDSVRHNLLEFQSVKNLIGFQNL
jgi:hypothetical protein